METEQKIKKYEFTYWLNPEIEEKDLESAINEISKLIEKMGGKVIDEREIIRDYFAYPIKHRNEGFLKINLINLPTDKIEEFSKILKLNNGVLRYSLGRSESIREPIKKPEIVKPIIKHSNDKVENVEKIMEEKQKEEANKNMPQELKKDEPEEKDNKIKLEDVDKKLEEILGNSL
jgi:small subunit ribosomal protein S6